tara:strand:- start:310 stop:1161 length:852 start_codon:yes stop_codon:yes gene_type:complete
MVLGVKPYFRMLLMGVALLGVSPLKANANSAKLEICLLENNLPYSSRATQSGFDYDVGKLLAKKLKRELVPVWSSNSRQILEIESDFPLRRLIRGDCSLILSVPGPEKKMGEGSSPAVTLGKPYYGAAFEVISTTNEGQLSFRKLKGKRVAIMSQTVAHFALNKVGASPVTYFSVEEALKGIVEGEADAALLWGPTSGWIMSGFDVSTEANLLMTKRKPPAGLSWNIHFASRTEDQTFRDEVSVGLQALQENGQLMSLMGKYDIPRRGSFESTHTPTTFLELR